MEGGRDIIKLIIIIIIKIITANERGSLEYYKALCVGSG